MLESYSFTQRTINVWNKLSTDCVHASSVNMFENRIDKYHVRSGYTMWTLDKPMASLSAAIIRVYGVPWMTILLNLV